MSPAFSRLQPNLSLLFIPHLLSHIKKGSSKTTTPKWSGRSSYLQHACNRMHSKLRYLRTQSWGREAEPGSSASLQPGTSRSTHSQRSHSPQGKEVSAAFCTQFTICITHPLVWKCFLSGPAYLAEGGLFRSSAMFSLAMGRGYFGLR